MGAVLELSRSYHARRTDVFRAWVSGEHLARWFRPQPDVEVTLAAIDVRPGGAFELELAAADGSAGLVRGNYHQIVEPERLVFELEITWGYATVLRADEVCVEFAEHGDTTQVRLTHGIEDEAEHAVIQGAWSACFDRMPAAFDDALERFYSRLEAYPRDAIYRSRFGGLWPDLEDAQEGLAGRQEAGLLEAQEVDLFRNWIEMGYVVLPGAVSEDVIDRLAGEVDELWELGHPEIQAEVFSDGRRRFESIGPACRELPHKVLDLHGFLESAREAIFSSAIRGFVTKLFERPPLAFQSLYFTYGTQQDLHQDTAYVVVRSPMEFCGCWIALEDVEEGAGELEYYVGSHRIEEFVWLGRSRAKPYDYRDESEFLRHLREEPVKMGLERVRFRARKGDALIWHADLVHGGSRVVKEGATRRSLVTHFCPEEVDPEYFGGGRCSEKVKWRDGYLCWRERG